VRLLGRRLRRGRVVQIGGCDALMSQPVLVLDLVKPQSA
jgi:hypothetical protein